jgi:hypothetical protein
MLGVSRHKFDGKEEPKLRTYMTAMNIYNLNITKLGIYRREHYIEKKYK